MEVTIPQTARIFSQQEADALVPTLQLSFAAISELRLSAEGILQDLSGGDPLEVAKILRGEVPPRPGEEALVDELQELIGEIGGAVEELTEKGLVIEELDPGVVDFPSVHGEKVVMLCWQFGEPSVEYFHEVEGAFEEREPLPHAHPMLS